MTAEVIIALLTLTGLEIVLGIDNIIFISILTDKLPPAQQTRGRLLGLAAAMVMRIVLLLSLTWIMRLTEPLFTIFSHGFSGRDLILIGGGLFLMAKSTHEIHTKLEGEEEDRKTGARARSFWVVILEIMVLDIVFSIDSVITAVGMANQLWVMMLAVVIAVGVMMLSSSGISRFVRQHPTVKMLALSFLLLIGFTLIGEGIGMHIAKGYVYFAIGFSVFVEFLNVKVRKKGKPVKLHEPQTG